MGVNVDVDVDIGVNVSVGVGMDVNVDVDVTVTVDMGMYVDKTTEVVLWTFFFFKCVYDDVYAHVDVGVSGN